MTNNKYGHDFDHPLSHLNALEMAWVAADSTVKLCEHCQPETELLPMTGTGWGLALAHQPHCPEHEDNQPT